MLNELEEFEAYIGKITYKADNKFDTACPEIKEDKE